MFSEADLKSGKISHYMLSLSRLKRHCQYLFVNVFNTKHSKSRWWHVLNPLCLCQPMTDDISVYFSKCNWDRETSEHKDKEAAICKTRNIRRCQNRLKIVSVMFWSFELSDTLTVMFWRLKFWNIWHCDNKQENYECDVLIVEANSGGKIRELTMLRQNILPFTFLYTCIKYK